MFWRCYLLKDLRILVCTCEPNTWIDGIQVPAYNQICLKMVTFTAVACFTGLLFAFFMTQCTGTQRNKSMFGIVFFFFFLFFFFFFFVFLGNQCNGSLRRIFFVQHTSFTSSFQHGLPVVCCYDAIFSINTQNFVFHFDIKLVSLSMYFRSRFHFKFSDSINWHCFILQTIARRSEE